jgi:peptidoglycan/xylan/chitin deacetylase (PgdA/CDA1 family)
MGLAPWLATGSVASQLKVPGSSDLMQRRAAPDNQEDDDVKMEDQKVIEGESLLAWASLVRIKRALTWYGGRIARKALDIPARAALGTITHVATHANVAALTFDDGPHAEYTPRVLEILERYQARATFFMLGDAAQKHPEIVRRVAQAGHSIGSHSWDHPSFPLISGRERRVQMRAWEQAVGPYASRIFRPPYGEQSLSSRLDAFWLGYKVIAWNVDAGDWWDRDAQRMAERLTSRVQPGCVIVMHDCLRPQPNADRRPKTTQEPCADREPMLKAISLFLDQVNKKWRFVTIPELLQLGRPHRENWYRVTPAGG